MLAPRKCEIFFFVKSICIVQWSKYAQYFELSSLNIFEIFEYIHNTMYLHFFFTHKMHIRWILPTSLSHLYFIYYISIFWNLWLKFILEKTLEKIETKMSSKKVFLLYCYLVFFFLCYLYLFFDTNSSTKPYDISINICD